MMNKLKKPSLGVDQDLDGNSSGMGGSKRQVLPGTLHRGYPVCHRKNLIAETKMQNDSGRCKRYTD